MIHAIAQRRNLTAFVTAAWVFSCVGVVLADAKKVPRCALDGALVLTVERGLTDAAGKTDTLSLFRSGGWSFAGSVDKPLTGCVAATEVAWFEKHLKKADFTPPTPQYSMCDALTTHWTRITEGRRERMASSSAPCGENWNPSLDPIVARVWAVTGDALKISRERERTAMVMPAKPAKPTDKPALSLVVDRKTTFSRPLETEVQASIERLIGDDIRRCYAQTLQATQGHGVFALSLVVAENGTATGLRVDRELDRSLARCVVHRLKARVFPKQDPSVEVAEEWDFQWSGAE